MRSTGRGERRPRRGGALLWTLAGLALAAAMAPLYVGVCHSLARLSRRGTHRLVATQRGLSELERLRFPGGARERDFPVPELPGGRGSIRVQAGPAPSVRRAELTLTWDEGGPRGRATWTTLLVADAPR